MLPAVVAPIAVKAAGALLGAAKPEAPPQQAQPSAAQNFQELAAKRKDAILNSLHNAESRLKQVAPQTQLPTAMGGDFRQVVPKANMAQLATPNNAQLSPEDQAVMNQMAKPPPL